jgi:hypothetical protein
MKPVKLLFILAFAFFYLPVSGQKIPSNKVIHSEQLSTFLTVKAKLSIEKKGAISQATLAQYFREKFSERYFYDWQNFEARFTTYNNIYSSVEKSHTERAKDHMSKYSGPAQWILPFNYLNGKPVNAYALRHLARQHKMVDIAFHSYYNNDDPKYVRYFVDQLNSLNKALEAGAYEKIEDGNGVYEAFRSGYRVLNWLQIHNMFLNLEEYSDEDQLTTIATLLQHGAHLYERNPKFHPGNHQTRGLSALAMISIILRDFEGTDVWYQHSMKLLGEHLAKEINADGFQFERSVHYHISDIGNFYYVYQLAKISGLEVEGFWEEKLKSLFSTLTKIAFPDKSAPVLQDDTDNPWAEKNSIAGAMTLGYLLFENPDFGYFAEGSVEAKMYWYLSDKQLSLLNEIQQKKPEFKSLHFPTTGYFVMRQGWKADDEVMVITAGLDDKKPDHQHGDMLGIQAIANGKMVLPNYQVRYSLPDLDLFKNSMVKNVALVDDELQGKKWRSNKGGSGFGKFGELPHPNVITWKTNKDIDLFVGSHDGFKNIGVDYSRQVIYVRNEFWIVKDNFKAEQPHSFKQVWQGHYSMEHQPNLLRASFDDATGFDIFQLNKVDELATSGARGKQWSVLSKNELNNFSFITILYPYSGYDNRINELEDSPKIKGWKLNASPWKAQNENATSVSKNEESLFFDIKALTYKGITIELSEMNDVYLNIKGNTLTIQITGTQESVISITGIKSTKLNGKPAELKNRIQPGDELKCKF